MKTKRADTAYCGVRAQAVKSAEPAFDKDILLMFSHYLKERYNIHLLKDVQHQKRPWTKDPILKTFKFTNVRREHDPTTRWVITHIINHPWLTYKQKVFNIILYRGYNKIETAELLDMPIPFGDDCLPMSYYKDRLNKYCDENPDYKPFTNAFMTSGFTRMLHDQFGTKQHSVLIDWIEHLYYDKTFFYTLIRCVSPKQVIELLTSINGVSSFLAYQIFVDFTYLEDFPFSENEYTLCGPGAKRGLERLVSDPDGLTPEELVFWMRDNWDRLMLVLPEEDRFYPQDYMTDLKPYDRCMNVMSIENCLCELYKYYKATTKSGRPRNKYRPRKRKEF